jgi:hypoxanthine-DNA glycosylase
MDATTGFSPILGAEAHTLILGTLPSQQSLMKQQYYGHPRNAFWPIMGELFAAGPEFPYAERTQLLSRHGIAVWDVLKSGHRPGSMDAAIDVASAIPNDFGKLYTRHPELTLVCFNGQAAGRLFRDLVPDEVQESLDAVRFVTMPSTSPAYAAMSFADKLDRWAIIG